MGEPGTRDAAATTRSHCVVHFQDRNHGDAMLLLAAVLDRQPEAGSPTVLIIAPTSDDALRLAQVRADSIGASGTPLTPVTAAVRGRRQLAAGPPAVAAAPSELALLLRESRLHLADLRILVLLWPEELLAADRIQDLESVIAEVPRSADRVAVVARRDSSVEEFLDRVMWRARRVDHTVRDVAPPVALRFVATGQAQRVSALRSVLDSFDPATTALVAFSDAGMEAARSAAWSLGAGPGDPAIQVVRGVPADAVSLVVLLEDVSAEALSGIATKAADVVAIVEPDRVGALRVVSGGGATPLSWSVGSAAARTALDALRDTLRETVASGAHIPWMPVMEPLLADLDPVEVAAAAAVLLDREQRKPRARRPAPEPAAGDEPLTRSGARPPLRSEGTFRDRPQAGRRDRRDVKVERPDRRGPAERPAGGRFGRPDSKGGARGPGARPPGSRAPEARGSAEGGRPGRNEGPRGPRRDSIDRMPRAAREGEEWAARGERLRNAKRERPGKRKE
ncbi:MAG TPA: hypothetical protein VF981_17145 [Gemmatimonadaceae bacterium]